VRGRILNVALLFAGVVFAFLLSEALLVAYLHLSDRAGADLQGLIAERETVLERALRREDQGTHDQLDGKILLHPFFGYTFNPEGQHTNNFGFSTKYDIELSGSEYAVKGVPKTNALVVGIFGGSFAEFVGRESEYMEERLRELFPNRHPAVLNFGVGGHALPQSAFIWLYFKDMVDVAVFVDGLNEVWNYPENNLAGVPPEYAKAKHYKFKVSRQEITPRTFELTEGILKRRRRIARLTSLSLLPVLRQSRIVHYTWRTLHRRWKRQVDVASREIVESYTSDRPFFEVEDERIVEFAVKRWGRYHSLVHSLSRQAGKLSVHVLQPNPFVPDSRKLTEKEKRLIRGGRVFEPWVQRGYPGLQAELGRLALEEGLVAEDMTLIFSDIADDIWIDGAHPNPRGTRMIVDRILELISEAKPVLTER